MTITRNISCYAVAAFLILGAWLIATPAQAETAADNYKLFCAQCHGTQMSGGGINAASLSVQPRNHTSAKDMGTLSDDNIALAIKKGGAAVSKSTFMPPFGGLLTDAEITDLVKYLRDACKCTYTPAAK